MLLVQPRIDGDLISKSHRKKELVLRMFTMLIHLMIPTIKNLAERAPLHEAVLGMVVEHHPPPHVAQRYRIPKIWPGDLNSEIGKSLISCDDKGPVVMMVTTINVDPQAGRIATGRLFSVP